MKRINILVLLAGLVSANAASAACYDPTTHNGNANSGYGHHQGYEPMPPGGYSMPPAMQYPPSQPQMAPRPGYYTPYYYAPPMQPHLTPEQQYQHMMKKYAQAETFFRKMAEHRKMMQAYQHMLRAQQAEAVGNKTGDAAPAAAKPETDASADTAPPETALATPAGGIRIPDGLKPDMNVTPVPADSPDSPPPPPPASPEPVTTTPEETPADTAEKTTASPAAPEGSVAIPADMQPSTSVAPMPADSADMPPPPPPPPTPAN